MLLIWNVPLNPGLCLTQLNTTFNRKKIKNIIFYICKNKLSHEGVNVLFANCKMHLNLHYGSKTQQFHVSDLAVI